jgi:hypothetical protein
VYKSIIVAIYRRGSPDAKISCVVSLGCGIYPPEPLGNTDIADALKVTNIHKVPSRLKELLNLLTTAVSLIPFPSSLSVPFSEKIHLSRKKY